MAAIQAGSETCFWLNYLFRDLYGQSRSSGRQLLGLAHDGWVVIQTVPELP